jgi:hypothetical protein
MPGYADHGVVDVVLFSLRPGVSRDQFLATVDPASAWVRQQPGFVSRELSYSSTDDRWIEVVKWESAESGDAAAAAEQAADECRPMFGLIDWDSIVLTRGELAIDPVLAQQ